MGVHTKHRQLATNRVSERRRKFLTIDMPISVLDTPTIIAVVGEPWARLKELSLPLTVANHPNEQSSLLRWSNDVVTGTNLIEESMHLTYGMPVGSSLWAEPLYCLGIGYL